jgi:hypothetical protein
MADQDNEQLEQPHSLNPADEAASKTPLEAVQETQARQAAELQSALQQSREVTEQRPDPSPEVPGQSNPSNQRKHPQRQMYGSGTNES